MTASLDRSSRDTIRGVLRKGVPALVAIYQFGSTVQGGEHGESDLDLAVLAGSPLPNLDRWRLQEDLAAELYNDVDLVDLRSASTVMQAQVIGEGKVILELDRVERQRFEMYVCSAYALLNEERAGIIEDVQARGRVYGR